MFYTKITIPHAICCKRIRTQGLSANEFAIKQIGQQGWNVPPAILATGDINFYIAEHHVKICVIMYYQF